MRPAVAQSAGWRWSRELWLRHAALGEAPAHRHLVGHQVRRLDADPRQPERLRDRGDDRHRAVRRHCQHPVDSRLAPDGNHSLDVGREVDHVRLVGVREADRLRIAVDRDDAEPELLRAKDGAPLVAAGADEEDGLHRGRCYSRTGNKKATRLQRESSHPFRRVNVADQRRPRKSPRTTAKCGPP